jgi:trimeric autotransporter adhesin
MRTRIAGLVVLAAVATAAAPAGAQKLAPAPAPFPSAIPGIATNQPVAALAAVGSRVYLGGDFSRVGPVSGAAVLLDGVTGRTAAPFPKVEGIVFVAIPDGAGGHYVGGAFGAVGGKRRVNLAHVLPDGTLDLAFRADTDRQVESMVLAGGRLWIGGDFRAVNGTPRRRLAALDPRTGAPDPAIAPNPDGQVEDLTTGGGLVIASGSFRGIAGRARNGLAAFSAVDGALDPRVDVVLDGDIDALLVAGDRLYVGGRFDAFAGRNRSGLAALDLATGELDRDFAPSNDGQVYALAFDATRGRVLAAGAFFEVAGKVSRGLVALDPVSGVADPTFKTGTDNAVYAVAVTPGRIWIGGEFTTVDGIRHNRLAALDPVTGAVDGTFVPDPNDDVYTLAVTERGLLAGGKFLSAPRLTRYGLVAVDGATGTLDEAFAPSVFGRSEDRSAGVRTIAATPDGRLAIGGGFVLVSGVARTRLAVLDPATGAVTGPQPPEPDGDVAALATVGGTLYAGGSFEGWLPPRGADGKRTRTGGVQACGFGPVPLDGTAPLENRVLGYPVYEDERTGKDVKECVDDPTVTTLLPVGGRLYVGGSFDLIRLRLRDVEVFRKGRFVTVKRILPTELRRNLIAVDPEKLAWDPSFAARRLFGSVRALATAGGKLYAAGDELGVLSFTTRRRVGRKRRLVIDEYFRRGVVAIDPRTGFADRAFLPRARGDVAVLAPLGDRLLVGGDFAGIGGQSLIGLALVDRTTGQATADYAPQVRFEQLDGTVLSGRLPEGGGVQTAVSSGGRLWVGGGFTGFGLGRQPFLAALAAPGTPDGTRPVAAPAPAR